MSTTSTIWINMPPDVYRCKERARACRTVSAQSRGCMSTSSQFAIRIKILLSSSQSFTGRRRSSEMYTADLILFPIPNGSQRVGVYDRLDFSSRIITVHVKSATFLTVSHQILGSPGLPPNAKDVVYKAAGISMGSQLKLTCIERAWS